MTVPVISPVKAFLDQVSIKNPHEPEFLQAVSEVAKSVFSYMDDHPKYREAKILERLIVPERIIMFRVPWVDDQGEIQINMGYRVQFNSAIGPYKGGLRFHPSVNLSILKFLGFEQVLKNALTPLPLGGGKGGSDFNPKGKSDLAVMRFCQSFMNELHRHIGTEQDIPAGDIGVGEREIGYLFGQYKRIYGKFSSILTGKGLEWGGSLIRPEATGYGTVYFAEEMLKTRNDRISGKTIAISGSGNVAQFATEKAIEMGAKVVTLSDSNGSIYDETGIDQSKLKFVMDLKEVKRGRIEEYARKYGCPYFEGERPWRFPVDIAMPCATENELDHEDAKTLIENGCFCVSEGANMPSTTDAVKHFQQAGILFGPGKASNAGGVATSGLEMSQNHLRLYWTREEVDQRLKKIMSDIHRKCILHGKTGDHTDYVKGANIAGFAKVAEAMYDQGIV